MRNLIVFNKMCSFTLRTYNTIYVQFMEIVTFNDFRKIYKDITSAYNICSTYAIIYIFCLYIYDLPSWRLLSVREELREEVSWHATKYVVGKVSKCISPIENSTAKIFTTSAAITFN